MREYMRRYLADPEKRAVHAARKRASTARRSAMEAGNRSSAVQCAQCGAKFTAGSRRVRYCSDACRKKGRARAKAAYIRRGRAPAARADAARCRACSREFAPSAGPGRPRAYCSDACRAEDRLVYTREHGRRQRLRGRGRGRDGGDISGGAGRSRHANL